MKPLPEVAITSKIYILRREKVMLDKDLAELYQVENKYLKRQVRRNIDRFPEDFMFILTKEETANLRSQIGTSSWGGSRYQPMVFTEQGVAQLSSVLNNKRAIQVNIQIIRLFTKMRKLLLTHKNLLLKIERIEQLLMNHDEDIHTLFEYVDKLIKDKKKEIEQASRKKIGFK